MPKIKSIIKNKKVIFTAIAIFFIIFAALWNIVKGGYDKQDKTILFLKKFIPSKIARKVRDTVFIIPNLKEQNKFLSTQVNKYEQGLNGELFNEEIVLSQKNKKEYSLKEFFLPFPRLDMRLGWAGVKNSRRAHHFAIVEDRVVVISGEGKTIYFKKKNILNKKLNQIEIPNNIKSIINENNSKLIGIRDLFIEDEKIYISIISKHLKEFTIDAYRADLNFEKLNFKLFFETKAYWPQYNVFSGGRFSTYKDNKILFTVGYSHIRRAAQQLNTLLGKIISIDKSTSEHKIISMGHRNPQGLFYVKNLNIIINTEHGPKGGDEINIIKKGANYGWPLATFGVDYDGSTISNNTTIPGAEDPIHHWTPSIAPCGMNFYFSDVISQWNGSLFLGALAGKHLNRITFEDHKIIDEERLFEKMGRFRQVVQGPDGYIYFITENPGVLYRILPSN